MQDRCYFLHGFPDKGGKETKAMLVKALNSQSEEETKKQSEKVENTKLTDNENETLKKWMDKEKIDMIFYLIFFMKIMICFAGFF